MNVLLLLEKGNLSLCLFKEVLDVKEVDEFSGST